jgi:hypothetical protein
MLSQLFPAVIDNKLAGSRWCVPLLVVAVGMKLLMGFNFSGLNPFVGAAQILETVDGIPLSTYPADSAAHLVNIAEAWGLLLFLAAGLWFTALFRYRGMVPLVTLLILLEQGLRMGLGTMLDVGRLLANPSPALLINWGLLVLLLVGFVLALLPGRHRS